MEKSNLDVAFELISKKKNSVEFKKLWSEVSQIQGMSTEEANEKVAKFYTQLSLDGRFVTLGNNTWDLRSRHSYGEVHIGMNDVYDELDEVETKEEYDDNDRDDDDNPDELDDEETDEEVEEDY